MTVEQILEKCKIEGYVVKLPDVTLDRKLYLQVKDKLSFIGGKWKGGNTQGFVFSMDPTDLLNSIVEASGRNLKKDLQFFETPDEIIRHMISLLSTPIEEKISRFPKMRILEPSAGRAKILNHLRMEENIPSHNLYYCEISPINRTFIKDSYTFICEDFLQMRNWPEWYESFDLIIANPPFSNNQDIDHVRLMYDLLKPGGEIVTITSPHWKLSSNQKERLFREWFNSLNSTVEVLPKGTFSKSGTEIETLLITIQK